LETGGRKALDQMPTQSDHSENTLLWPPSGLTSPGIWGVLRQLLPCCYGSTGSKAVRTWRKLPQFPVRKTSQLRGV
jgi:hypothetical protein